MNLNEKRNYLRNLISVEDKILSIKDTLERDEKCKAMMLLDHAIPCILHMENRIGEKMLSLLLNEVMVKMFQLSEEQRLLALERVEHFINHNITGDEHTPGQWSIPLDKDKKKIESITMSNTLTRIFVNEMDCLVNYILDKPDEVERKNNWIDCLHQYQMVMQIACQRNEFTDDDIERFQQQCDIFFGKWVDLHGTKGITNYIHMIGSGHLSYYLKKYRNLYRYSQQGWEALNKKIKEVFFNNTQKGGYVKIRRGEQHLQQNYIKPIARFLLRDAMWKTRLAHGYFMCSAVNNT